MEQSPFNFDQVVFADLAADYATRVNVQVLNGSDSSGQVKGILNASGINTVSFTGTTQAALYPKIADAIQKIHTNRFLSPTVLVMHPRRWAWFLSALDSQNRPLVVPNAGGPMNAMGNLDAVASQQVVGQLQGLPVVTDPSIPTSLGTNEDTIIAMRASDCILYESALRTRVLPDVGSGQLTVRLQVYGYLAFTAERYPAGVTKVTGSGLTTPSF
ncbi:MAG: phage major capsid protein [Betaproteobacteria bacterium]|nr:phage major capsid protein [Betaproteobacteria bacterium]